VRALRRGFALPPALARATVTLPLAVRSTAYVLPITGAWMWMKPMPADPARTRAAHVVLRNKSENRTAQTRSGQRWVNSDERRRVNSGERRRVFDAHLAAVMIESGVDHILTFNVDDFRRYPGITAVSPQSFSVPRTSPEQGGTTK
jgi:predicted nucleic acid-binding protein